MCGSRYLYVSGFCYLPNAFLALPKLSVFRTGDKGGDNYICEYGIES